MHYDERGLSLEQELRFALVRNQRSRKNTPTMSGSYLDLETWPRRSQFDFFRVYDQPFFSVTTDVRVSEVYRLSRAAGGPSFFLSTLYLSLRAANQVEELRLRLRGAKVWRHDRIHGASTLLRPDATFGFGYFDFEPEYAVFAPRAKAVIDRVKHTPGELDPQDHRDDLIHFSVLPWIRFTSFSHARKLEGSDSVPKIVFGKRFEREGDFWMPVSIAVHHALVDGVHVGRFLEIFEAELSEAGAQLTRNADEPA